MALLLLKDVPIATRQGHGVYAHFSRVAHRMKTFSTDRLNEIDHTPGPLDTLT